jgi:AraC family transcriptional regulator, regulatory protein of adaptative response / methylated-DNA-[protein]-cysteine methyltransferase
LCCQEGLISDYNVKMETITQFDTQQAALDYERVEKAIDYIEAHFKQRPALPDIADHVHLSPFHFERLFVRWAGTTPQRFMRYLTTDYAKTLLDQRHNLIDVADAVGLSGPSRLHDLFVTFEGLSPGEYKQGGVGLTINYGFHATPFGACLLALTARGICSLTFQEKTDHANALADLKTKWPRAVFQEDMAITSNVIGQIFDPKADRTKPFHLLVRGTNFQIKVWEALLKIPAGQVADYGSIARQIGAPGAVRAVGTACGSNPVALLIPCHRVLQRTGGIGGYRWGTSRKRAILGWEAAQLTVQAA